MRNEMGLGGMSGAEIRALVRTGHLRVPTGGVADGFMQANVVILPAEHAADFLLFCARNPRSCPFLGASAPGDPAIPTLGVTDIRREVPRYRVHRWGAHTETVDDLDALWRDDLVAVALGCSFSFESAIQDAGIAIRHIAAGRNVPMYVSNIPTRPAGPFHGQTVVSMRSFRPADLIEAILLSDRFPLAHGAPLHIGDPDLIGIADIARPEFGDAPVIEEGDLLGFWACGVTPQRALQEAGIEFAITHEPGYMLVTDLPATHRGACPARSSRTLLQAFEPDDPEPAAAPAPHHL